MKEFAYYRPRTLEDALGLREAHEGARFIAGGTDLQIREWKRQARPWPLISLRSVAGLSGIETGETLSIGASTTVGEIAAHAALGERYPALREAARALGSVQIRNVATIGGNLCRAAPCADLAPPLYVYDARVRIGSRHGTREVPLEEFMVAPGRTCLGPGEIATAILVPAPPRGARGVFLKKGRVRMDLSLASVAALVRMEGDRFGQVRLAAGSVAPRPIRLRSAEALLEGARATPALLAEAGRAAAADTAPISDVRTTAEYRRRIVEVYVRRALETLSARGNA